MRLRRPRRAAGHEGGDGGPQRGVGGKEEGERVEDELGLAGGPGPASFDSGLAALALRSGCAGAVRDLARGGQAQAQTAIALPADSPAAEVPV